MPPYCDPPDIGRFAVNREALADLSVEEDLLPAISWASTFMDSFLNRLGLPLTSWGDDIRGCAAVLAGHKALTTRGWKPGENPEDQPLVAEVKYLREKWLPGIAAGSIVPVGAVGTIVPGGPSGSVLGGRPAIASNEQRGFFNEDPSRALPFQGRRRI